MTIIEPPISGVKTPPAPYYSDATITVHHQPEDGFSVLASMPDASVDAVVCDPPYGLEFMGKAWDGADGFRRTLNSNDVGRDNAFGRTSRTSPEYRAGALFQSWCELWTRECLRVLKPGGHLLAFGGTRTFHRLACAIEDAGFEVRDSIAWLYGSGFPKSLDVSKAIDKARHDRPEVLAVAEWLRDHMAASGIPRREIGERFGLDPRGVDLWAPNPSDNSATQRVRTPTWEQWRILSDLLSLPDDMDAEVWRLNGRKGSPGEAWAAREVVGSGFRVDRHEGHVNYGSGTPDGHYDITAPATPDAERWQGWGTALKPAFEPIVVGRKPLIGTVAANVLAHGTGALNIDGCRTAALGRPLIESRSEASVSTFGDGLNGSRHAGSTDAGRWPANAILDESQAEVLDAQSGESLSRIGKPRGADHGEGWGMTATGAEYDDQGGASRFFYVAKADQSERVRVGGIAHPTVKPLDLMRWLVRLVTPPGGTVLEPFAGSGTTVEACILEGFKCTAIEREADYLPLIVQRINRRRDPVAAIKAQGDDGGLFELLDGGAA